MKPIAIILCLSLTGCEVAHYQHITYYPDGKVQSSIDAWTGKNAFDSKASAATLTFADGTVLNLTQPTGNVDPTVVGAAQTFGQALLAIGAAAAKVAGVLP